MGPNGCGLLDAKLVELPQLEEREERRRLLQPRQPVHLLVERESPAAPKHRAESLEEPRDGRERELHVGERDLRRLGREQAKRGAELLGILRREPELRLRRQRRRAEPEVPVRLRVEPLREPRGRRLHAPVRLEPLGQLLRRLLGAQVGEVGCSLREELAGLDLEHRAHEHEELSAGLEIEPALVLEPLGERRDDVGHLDLGEPQLLLEDERQQQVERALERVEVEVQHGGCHPREANGAGGRVPWGRPWRGLRAATPGRRRSGAGPWCLRKNCHQMKNAVEQTKSTAATQKFSALAEELVRRIDAQLLLEEPPERVPRDVEREEPRRPDADEPLDEQQQADADEVEDELVEEDRVEVLRATGRRDRGSRRGSARRRCRAPRAGRSARRRAPGSTSCPTGRWPGRAGAPARRIREQGEALAGTPDDDAAGDDAEEDAAPDAEASLPDRDRPVPLVRELVVARDDVVEAGADDAGGDAPDRDAQHEVPVAAATRPTDARERRSRTRSPRAA